MQTFLPVPDFQRSAEILDNKRQWKQTVEAKYILGIIDGTCGKKGFINHPAVRAWRGYVPALTLYFNIFLTESINRGVKVKVYNILDIKEDIIMPYWFGMEEYHKSHRLSLLKKNPNFYSKYGWENESFTGYYWPV